MAGDCIEVKHSVEHHEFVARRPGIHKVNRRQPDNSFAISISAEGRTRRGQLVLAERRKRVADLNAQVNLGEYPQDYFIQCNERKEMWLWGTAFTDRHTRHISCQIQTQSQRR